ncbi:hypothetical protein PCASD_04773 [Puccinia coronata f. sp. avenae]|uniref:Pectinesterase inhibitor domain-containing protein n=1 Tax=Puccinia coronata f. sp. avenae TaxID=200324 RepID=A0A2N5V7A4_9BASI|nr:hypothetical protein PCASD_04773 [Puccinia coronata f. sp. avenae]
MLASQVISTLSIVCAFVNAHLFHDQFAPRDICSISKAATASSSYQSLTTQIQTIRYNIASGQYSLTETESKIKLFSYQASSTLMDINDSLTCIHSDSVYSLTQSAQQTYSELDLLVDTCYQVYPQQASSLFSSWSHLDSHFHRNLKLLFDSGVKARSILPSTFGHTCSRAS